VKKEWGEKFWTARADRERVRGFERFFECEKLEQVKKRET